MNPCTADGPMGRTDDYEPAPPPPEILTLHASLPPTPQRRFSPSAYPGNRRPQSEMSVIRRLVESLHAKFESFEARADSGEEASP